MVVLEEVRSLQEVRTELTGHYWSFPEIIWTFGNGLRGARLVRLETDNCLVYLRVRISQATVVHWQGSNSSEDTEEVLNHLKAAGFSLIGFNPLEKELPLPGYRYSVWYSRGSLIDHTESQNRRWQLRRSLKEFDFQLMEKSDMSEAIECLKKWRIESERRHGNEQIAAHLEGLPYNKNHNEMSWVMGFGHYLYSTEHHFEISNSHFFVARSLED